MSELSLDYELRRQQFHELPLITKVTLMARGVGILVVDTLQGKGNGDFPYIPSDDARRRIAELGAAKGIGANLNQYSNGAPEGQV